MGTISTDRPRKYIKLGRTQFLRGESIENWPPDLVKREIINLSQRHQRFTVRIFGIYRTPTPDPYLSKVIGRPASRKFLYHTACVHFGTWEKALASCGLQPTQQAPNRFWDKKLVTESIMMLAKAGHPLTVKSIWRDRSRSSGKILFAVTGRRTTGSSLHDAARRYFGSWDMALTAAGVDTEFVKEKPFWTKRKIIIALKAARREGVQLNTFSLGKDCSKRTANIIGASVGKKRVGRSLYGGAYRIFGSWDKALLEAKINPLAIRKSKFVLNRRSIARLLNVLYESDIPINRSSISRDRSEETNSILFSYTGQNIKAPELFKLGYTDFGSWDSTLKFSGFRLSDIRRSGSPCFRDKEKLVELIRALHKNEYALNRSAIGKNSYTMMRFIEDQYEAAISGQSMLNAALLEFEDWDKALWESGLDPGAIRLRSRPYTRNLPIISHQKEDVIVDGERRISRFLGGAPKNPEELMEERETSGEFQAAMDQMEDEDHEILQQIFDSILNIHHHKDQTQLVAFIAQDLGNTISEEKIRSLLGHFKNQFMNQGRTLPLLNR